MSTSQYDRMETSNLNGHSHNGVSGHAHNSGRLGVLIVGFNGAVSTTYVAGILGVRSGSGVPVGSLAEDSREKGQWLTCSAVGGSYLRRSAFLAYWT